MKFRWMISIVFLFGFFISQDRSTIFSTGSPQTTDGYLLTSDGMNGLAVSEQFSVSDHYVMSAFSLFLGLDSQAGTVVVRFQEDDSNSPGDILLETTITLDSQFPMGHEYTVDVNEDCMELFPDTYYWLTVFADGTESQVVWQYAPASFYAIATSDDLGDTWMPMEYGIPGASHIWADVIFSPYELFPGDINSDFLLDVTDIVSIVGLILEDVPLSQEMLLITDISGDGMLDVLDVVIMVDIILNGPDSLLPGFALEDINPGSPTFGEMVGPSLYEGQVSCYYFGKAG